jgi:hypothetical protein
LREALAYHTPLQAVEIPAGDGFNQLQGMNTGTWSLASANSPSAILTVAKPGGFDPTSLVLRLYQPTNGGEKFQVTLGGGAPASLRLVTAAEGEWRGPPPRVQPDSTGFTIDMREAIATVQIDGMGLPARAPRPK